MSVTSLFLCLFRQSKVQPHRVGVITVSHYYHQVPFTSHRFVCGAKQGVAFSQHAAPCRMPQSNKSLVSSGWLASTSPVVSMAIITESRTAELMTAHAALSYNAPVWVNSVRASRGTQHKSIGCPIIYALPWTERVLIWKRTARPCYCREQTHRSEIVLRLSCIQHMSRGEACLHGLACARAGLWWSCFVLSPIKQTGLGGTQA